MAAECCMAEGIIHDSLEVAIDLFATRLKTPQIEQHLKLALEEAYHVGESSDSGNCGVDFV